MNKILAVLFVIMISLSCNNQSNHTIERKAYAWPQGLLAPVCDTVPKLLTAHGDTRMDEYYWLNQYGCISNFR